MKWYLVMIGVIAVAIGCTSQNGASRQAITDNPKEVTLRFGDTLRYDVGFFGDEEGAQVIKSPRFNAFEGFCSDNYEPLIYCYTASTWFEGGDTVIIKTSRGSDGSSPNTEHEIHELIIKLTQK